MYSDGKVAALPRARKYLCAAYTQCACIDRSTACARALLGCGKNGTYHICIYYIYMDGPFILILAPLTLSPRAPGRYTRGAPLNVFTQFTIWLFENIKCAFTDSAGWVRRVRFSFRVRNIASESLTDIWKSVWKFSYRGWNSRERDIHAARCCKIICHKSEIVKADYGLNSMSKARLYFILSLVCVHRGNCQTQISNQYQM